MAARVNRWIVPALALLLTACGSTGPVVEPAPLSDIQSRFKVDRDWQHTVSVGKNTQVVSIRPLVDKDSLYIADGKGRVYAWDRRSGKKHWRIDSDLMLASGIGADSTQLYMGDHDGAVIALRKDDGTVVWHSQVSSEILTPPLAVQDIVLVRTVDGQLFALDSHDGHRLWVYDSSVPSLSLHGMGRPVVVDDQVMAGFANGQMVALDIRDGHLLWNVTVSASTGRSELERLVDIDATPAVSGNILYAAAYQGNIVAIHIPSGRVLWTRELSSYRDLVVGKSALYVTDDESIVWALDLNSGSPLWKQPGLFERRLTAPMLNHGQLVVGDFEGYLHWLDLQDGSIVARKRVDSSPVAAILTDDQDTLYAVSSKGVVTRLKFKEIVEKSMKRKEQR